MDGIFGLGRLQDPRLATCEDFFGDITIWVSWLLWFLSQKAHRQSAIQITRLLALVQ